MPPGVILGVPSWLRAGATYLVFPGVLLTARPAPVPPASAGAPTPR